MTDKQKIVSELLASGNIDASEAAILLTEVKPVYYGAPIWRENYYGWFIEPVDLTIRRKFAEWYIAHRSDKNQRIMNKKIKAQYIGERTSTLIPEGIYYLILAEQEPNTVELENGLGKIAYASVYDFFKSWKLN